MWFLIFYILIHVDEWMQQTQIHHSQGLRNWNGFFNFIVLMIGSIFLFKALDFALWVSLLCSFLFPQFVQTLICCHEEEARKLFPCSEFFQFLFVKFWSFVGLCCLDPRTVVESERKNCLLINFASLRLEDEAFFQ